MCCSADFSLYREMKVGNRINYYFAYNVEYVFLLIMGKMFIME